MQRIHTITTRNGVDVGYHESPIHPLDGEGRVGGVGLDKTLKFEDVLNIAYKTFTNDGNRANIIVKAGKNAKWYLKYCPLNKIDDSINKQTWRNTSRCRMYIVTWDDNME